MYLLVHPGKYVFLSWKHNPADCWRGGFAVLGDDGCDRIQAVWCAAAAQKQVRTVYTPFQPKYRLGHP